METQPETVQTNTEVADREAVREGRIKTERLHASRPEDIARAATILRSGGLVAFPTETVYGLGANALDAAAVEKIFLAKRRPHWDPLIVHISDLQMLQQVVDLPQANSEQRIVKGRVEALTREFWPGPLTLLLPRAHAVPGTVTAGRPLVGARMPSNRVALDLISQAGVPIAAPSANRFGHTSPTTAAHVLADLDGRIDAALDGGSSTVGVESTVLDPTQWPMILYRQGAVTQQMIQVHHGRESVVVFTPPAEEAEPESLPSPGVGLRHYAPNARLLLVPVHPDLLDPRNALAEVIQDQAPSESIGVLLPNGWSRDRAAHAVTWGDWDQQEVLARNLFAGLRALDDLGATAIIAPIPNGFGIAAAIRDRLEKAARTS